MKKIFSKLILSVAALFAFAGIAQAQYCSVSYGTNCTSGDYINNFSFNTITNNSTGCTSGNYNNTGLSTLVQPGFTYSFSASFGSYSQALGIYVDYNQDNDFSDSGEQVWVTSTSSSSQSGSFTIPGTASTGNTRMRVICAYYATPPSNGCGYVSYYGETEDYTLTIQAPVTGVPDCTTYNTPADGSSGACPSIGINFNWNFPSSGGTPTAYNLYIGTSNPPTTLVSSVAGFNYTSSSLSPSTLYYWMVEPTNSYGTATNCTVYSFTTGPGCYCTPDWDYASNSYNYNYITKVELGSLSNNNTSYNPYQDFTSLTAPQLEQGATYPITITCDNPGGTNSVWIDFDDSYSFDAGEMVVANQYDNYTNPNTYSILIPGTAPIGNHTMRVMHNYWYYYQTANDPCAVGSPYEYAYGNAEDYTIEVIAPVALAPNCPESLYTLTSNTVNDYSYGYGTTYPSVTGTFNSAVAGGNLRLYYNGYTGYYPYYCINVYDENGNSLGYAGTGYCSDQYIDFAVSQSTINSWIADGTVSVTLQGGYYTYPYCTTGSYQANFVLTYDDGNSGPSYTAPADGSTGVCTADGLNFSWNYSTGAGTATDYLFYLGTDNPPTNIMNGTSLGVVNSYFTNSALPANTYYWQVVPVNAFGNNAPCAIYSFSTVDCYCTPDWDYGSNNYYITNVTLNTLNNSSGGGTGLEDFTSLTPTQLEQGATYNISVTKQYSYGTVSVWVDFDDSYSFDSGEMLVANQYDNGNSTVTYSMAIPGSAPLGNHTMRVMNNYWYYIQTANDPCAVGSQYEYAYGQAEDYTVEIIAPVPLAPGCSTYNSPSNGQTGICGGNPLTLSWNLSTTGGTATDYLLYFGTDNPPTNINNGTSMGVTTSYTFASLSPNTYYWSIVPTNSFGNSGPCTVYSFSTDPCYCTPSFYYGANDIYNFNLGTFSSSTFTYSNYEDKTSLGPIVVEQGATYNYSFNTNYYCSLSAMWCDFNDDYSFDPSEAFFTNNYDNCSGQYSGTITIPGTAPIGQHRLRVLNNYYYYFFQADDPCPSPTTWYQPYVYGQVEDYTLEVIAPVALPPNCPVAQYSITSSTCYDYNYGYGSQSVSSTGTYNTAVGNGTLRVYYDGYVGYYPYYYISVYDENGNYIGDAYENGHYCGGLTYIDFPVTQSQVNSWIADGTVSFNFTGGPYTYPYCSYSYTAYTILSYDDGNTGPSYISPADGTTGICGSDVISFNWNYSTGAGTATDYLFYLGTDNPPTNIMNGTSLGVVNTYDYSAGLAAGTYYWMVVPVNSFGNNAPCAIYSFSTIGCYCTPNWLYGANDITQFDFGSFSNYTGYTYQEYENFSNTVIPNVQAGSNVTWTIGNNYGYTTNSIWIDYDDDYLFETSERIVSSVFTYSNSNTGTVTISASAPVGQHRMRVMNNYWYNSQTAANPCPTGNQNYAYGQAEDYTVEIIAALPCVTPSVGGSITGSSTVQAGDANTFSLTGYTADFFQWQYSTDNVNWNNILGAFTDSESLTFNIIGTVYLRVEVVSGSCTADYSAVFTINVTERTGDTQSNPHQLGVVNPGSYSYSDNTGLYLNNVFNASPDVFYKFTTGSCVDYLELTTCGGASWDTWVRILNASGSSLVSNDDNCGVQSTVTLSVTPNTDYYLLMEGYSSNSGSYTLYFNVYDNNVFTAPTIFGTVAPVCNAFTLDAGAGYSSYAWSTGGSNQIEVVNNSVNNVNVTVTDVYGCAATSNNVDVDVVTPPVAAAGNDLNICTNTSAALYAGAINNNYTGQWTLISGTGIFANPNNSSTLVAGLSQTNVYEWTVTDVGNVCPPSSDQVTVNTIPKPTSLNTISTTSNSALVEWSCPVDPDSFLVRYQKDCTGSFFYTWVPGNVRQATLMSTSGSGLDACTNYCFRVRAQCTGAPLPQYSATTGNFTTAAGASCVAVTNVTIANNAACNYNVSWSNCVSADSFRVRYKLSTATTWSFSSWTTGYSATVPMGPGTWMVRVQSKCGSNIYTTGTTNYTIGSCRTAGEVEELVSNLILFPNPTSDRSLLNFSSATEGDYVLTLTDLSGRVLNTVTGVAVAGENTAEINVNGFAKGVYFVGLTLNGETRQVKLTVQ